MRDGGSVTDAQRPLIEFPGRIGVWWASDSWSTPKAQDVAREIEALGYGSLFLPEAIGQGVPDAVRGVPVGHRTTRRRHRHRQHPRPDSARPPRAAAGLLNALFPGRFVLGLGVSHAPLVERALGGSYAKPLATMRDYLERMAAVPDVIEPGAARPVRLLAALGPKMIELSGTHADGAHPYLVLPDQTAPRAPSSAPTSGSCPSRPSPSAGTADEQLQRAHGHLDGYSGSAQLPELVAAPGLRRIRPGAGRLRPAGPRTGRDGFGRRRGGLGARAPRRGRRPRRGSGARRRPDGRPAAGVADAGEGAWNS